MATEKLVIKGVRVADILFLMALYGSITEIMNHFPTLTANDIQMAFRLASERV